MTEWGWRQFYAFGGLLFVALILFSIPDWMEVVGWGFALWFVFWVSPFREDVIVRKETRRIDIEHERL